MTYKEQASAGQWKALINTPGAAAAVVSSASDGLMDMVKETLMAGQFIQESITKLGQTSHGTLVNELLEAMKAMTLQDMQANSQKYQAKDPTALRAEAKQLVAEGFQAATALGDVQGYKQWVLEMSRQVAQTKTGGSLGMRGQAVIDEKEQAALDELAAL